MPPARKIWFLAFGVCLLALLWDDLSLRLCQLERINKNHESMPQRLQQLENLGVQIKVLESQVADLNKNQGIFNETLSQTNARLEQLRFWKESFFKGMLTEKGIQVLSVPALEDITISSYQTHLEAAWGEKKYLTVGLVTVDYRYRSLIEFAKPENLKNKKIVGAVLYLKQIKTDSWAEGKNAVTETIDLYAVKKKWHEGHGIRGVAEKGQATWISARTGEELWSKAGCSAPGQDFENVVLASSGPVINGFGQDWAMIIFNEEGLKRLQQWMAEDPSLENGFLLKARDEKRDFKAMFFHSHNSYDQKSVPYLEIYYLSR